MESITPKVLKDELAGVELKSLSPISKPLDGWTDYLCTRIDALLEQYGFAVIEQEQESVEQKRAA